MDTTILEIGDRDVLVTRWPNRGEEAGQRLSLDPDSWPDTIRSARGGRCIVLVSGPLLQSGRVQLPATSSPEERAKELESASRRSGAIAGDEDLAIGYRDQTADDAWQASFVAAPDSLIRGVRDALSKRSRTYITAVEQGLAAVFAPAERQAILAVQDDTAQLILAASGHVEASRRFKLPMVSLGDLGGTLDIGTLIAGEVQRTLRFFADQGHQPAHSLTALGSLTDPEEIEQIRELAGLQTANAPLADVADASLEFHRRLAKAFASRVQRPPCLAEPERIRWGRLIAKSAVQLAGSAGIVVGGMMLEPETSDVGRRFKREFAALELEARQQEQRIEAARQAIETPHIVRERNEILAALRHPQQSVSRLLASLAARRPDGLWVQQVALSQDSQLSVRGIITVRDRAEAVRRFGEFDQQLRAAGLTHGVGNVGVGDSPFGVPFRFTATIERSLP